MKSESSRRLVCSSSTACDVSEYAPLKMTNRLVLSLAESKVASTAGPPMNAEKNATSEDKPARSDQRSQGLGLR